MAPLKFKYKRLGLTHSQPINEKMRVANELKITVALADYLEEINKVDAYILVLVSRDGETFRNELIGYNNPECLVLLNN